MNSLCEISPLCATWNLLTDNMLWFFHRKSKNKSIPRFISIDVGYSYSLDITTAIIITYNVKWRIYDFVFTAKPAAWAAHVLVKNMATLKYSSRSALIFIRYKIKLLTVQGRITSGADGVPSLPTSVATPSHHPQFIRHQLLGRTGLDHEEMSRDDPDVT